MRESDNQHGQQVAMCGARLDACAVIAVGYLLSRDLGLEGLGPAAGWLGVIARLENRHGDETRPPP